MVEEDKQIKDRLLAELRERRDRVKRWGEGKMWKGNESEAN